MYLWKETFETTGLYKTYLLFFCVCGFVCVTAESSRYDAILILLLNAILYTLCSSSSVITDDSCYRWKISYHLSEKESGTFPTSYIWNSLRWNGVDICMIFPYICNPHDLCVYIKCTTKEILPKPPQLRAGVPVQPLILEKCPTRSFRYTERD